MSARTLPGRAVRRPSPRALVALGPLLVRRRARRDLALLCIVWALVTLSVLAALAGPRLARATLEDALRQAVSEAGSGAHLTLQMGVGADAYATGLTAPESPQSLWRYVRDLDERVPPATLSTLDRVVATVVSPGHDLLRVRGAQASPVQAAGALDLTAVAGWADAVEVVEGRLPRTTAPEAPVEIALPEAAAAVLGLSPGDTVTVAGFDDQFRATEIPLAVVGVVAAEDPDAPLWMHLAAPWAPVAELPSVGLAATALLAEDALTDVVDAHAGTAVGHLTLVPDPAAFDSAAGRRVLDEVTAAEEDVTRLAGSMRGGVALTTELGDVLREHHAAARAATLQMSVPQAGVSAVAAVVLVLLAQLLVTGRAGVLALERARGSSVPAIGLRLAAESAVVTALGVTAGAGLAHLLVPGPVLAPGPVVAVAAAALLGPPVLGAWAARRAWAGRRVPANRRERAVLARRRAVRRLVAEAGVLVAAVAAVVSLRGRGLLAAGPDPFLSVTPVLLALVAALLVVRVLPALARPLAAVGRRSRGALGVLGAAGARRAVTALPLVALTLGTCVAVTSAVLVDTVRTGQVQASWDRVGADVRVDGASAEDVARSAPGSPGVDAVGSAVVVPEATLDVGSITTTVSLLGVDAGYVDLVRHLPGAAEDLSGLADLVGRAPRGDTIPAVVDPEVAQALSGVSPAIAFRGRFYTLEVVGTTEHRPSGQYPGPFVLADLTALGGTEPPERTTTWVLGPGAHDAVADVPPQAVTTRSGWLTERRDLEHLAGVERLMVLAGLAVLALGAVGLAATVVVGARERGRTLAMLRTLGMRVRAGWWLALAEIAPTVVMALVAGAGTGVLVVGVLGDALGLDVLTGGARPPTPTVAPTALATLGAGAVVLVGLALLTEVVVHRRDRLADVLRAGEIS